MLQFFKTFFSEPQDEEQGNTPWYQQSEVQEVIAALLIEVARADHNEDPEEREEIQRLLCDFFSIEPQKVFAMFANASERVDQYIALHPFTQTLKSNLSPKERESVVEMMWAVAYADGTKDADEEYMIRKTADLLQLPHAAFIRTRQRVEQSLAQSEKR